MRAGKQPRVEALTAAVTTAVRDFRRVTSTSAFASRWLGTGSDALDGGQYDVLDRLTERDNWRMGELAGALRVDPSAVTRAVLPLERSGLVERTRDPDDRRAVQVRITAEGRARHGLARSRGRELWGQALRDFSDQDLADFAALTERLTTSFEHVLFGTPQPVGARRGPPADSDERREQGEDVDMEGVLRRLADIESRLSARGAVE